MYDVAGKTAVQIFNDLEDMAVRIDEDFLEVLTHILDAEVKSEGKTLASLDPTGNSSDLEIDNRIFKACGRRYRDHARERLEILEGEQGGISTDDWMDIHSAVEKFYECAKKAGKSGYDLSSLDPAKPHTVQQMQHRIDEAARNLYCECARGIWSNVVRAWRHQAIGPDYVDEKIADIRKCLYFSQRDASILDDTGTSTAQQMEDQLKECLKDACVWEAQDKWERLSTPGWYSSKQGAEDCAKAIRKLLARVHVDASALEYGNYSAQTMEASIDDAVAAYGRPRRPAANSAIIDEEACLADMFNAVRASPIDQKTLEDTLKVVPGLVNVMNDKGQTLLDIAGDAKFVVQQAGGDVRPFQAAVDMIRGAGGLLSTELKTAARKNTWLSAAGSSIDESNRISRMFRAVRASPLDQKTLEADLNVSPHLVNVPNGRGETLLDIVGGAKFDAQQARMDVKQFETAANTIRAAGGLLSSEIRAAEKKKQQQPKRRR